MLKQYLECGKVVSVHGIAGELRFQPWCDVNDLKKVKSLYLDELGQKEIKLISARPHNNIVILKLQGIDTVELANTLRNKILYLTRDSIKLNPGEFFIQDLIGLQVINYYTNNIYGKIIDVIENSANNVYVIKFPDGSEKLFPAVKEFIEKTDIENGTMLIKPIPGLLDDNGETIDEQN